MARILLFGSLNWDVPIRLSGPVAPGARLVGRSADGRLGGVLGGGGANTGAGLVMAGHEVAIVTTVSEDGHGGEILNQAQALGLDTRFVTRVPAPTPRTLVLLDPAGERTIVHVDRAAAPHPGAALPTLEALAAFDAHAVYARRVDPLARAFLTHMMSIRNDVLRVAQWPTGADSKQALDVHALLVSRDDLGDQGEDGLWHGPKAQARARLDALILTCGAEGADLTTDMGQRRIPAPAASCVDSTGAGDAFAAGLIHARLAGLSWENAVAHGNQWGALTVGQEGGQPPAEVAGLACAILE